MQKPTQKKPLKKTDLKSILFDALMVYIEPDLMIENRTYTAQYLSNLPKEEHALQMKQYQMSYEIFLDRWPDFVQSAVNDMKGIHADYKEMGLKNDAKEMLNIEDALDHFQPDDA